MNSKMFILLLVLVNTVKATESNTISLKVGDQFALPGGINTPVGEISWKLNGNKVAEWDPFHKMHLYNEFKDRTTLDITNGNILIRDVRTSDSGTFSLDFNSTLHKSFEISVINKVPTPTISFICDTHMTSCSLTCGGNTTGAGTVTYDWKADGADLDVSDKTYITENNNTKTFTCMMKNGVSQKESAPHRNSLYSPVPDETERTPPDHVFPTFSTKTLLGISLFVLLITATIVLVFMHKCKSGVWFYEKESMPWEAGFWRKQENLSDQESQEIMKSMKKVKAGAAEGAGPEGPGEENGT